MYLAKHKLKVLKALNFLGILIPDKERDKYVNDFISELRKGIADRKSSLAILPSFVKFTNKVTYQEKVAVLQAGNANLSKGYFKAAGEKLEIFSIMTYPMPGLGREISKEKFFKELIINSRDVLRNSDKIGFCFRHAIEANSDNDGKLLRWARGIVNVPDLVGTNISCEFKKHLKEEFGRDYKVIILNDTVATLIAGLVKTKEKEYEDFIGLTHSDGYNLSYIEEGRNLKKFIKKKKFLSCKMVLNTQAGSFGQISETKVDNGVRSLLGKVQVGRFSQKVNSSCLPLVFKVLVKEISGKILNERLCKRIEKLEDLDLEQMYLFYSGGLKSNSYLSSVFRYGTLEDAANLGIIIDRVIQRAALLIAIQISGILKYKDIGHNPIQPVGVIVEGDFHEIVKDFEDRVRCEIEKYFGRSDPRYFKFLHIQNSTMLGAGIAAAINL